MAHDRPSLLSKTHQSGVTLVELMVALTFGLLLILAAISLYVSNHQTFRRLESMSRINENARIAFELLGRNLRHAGSAPCRSNMVSNVLNNKNIVKWGANQNVIVPYGKTQNMPDRAFGSGAAQRVRGTDAFTLFTTDQDHLISVKNHDLINATIQLNTKNHGFVKDDILMVCTDQFSTIFQASNDTENSEFLKHEASSSLHSGNCTSILRSSKQDLIKCETVSGMGLISKDYASTVETGAKVVKLITQSWYIANNGRGGRSLYRMVRGSTPDEVVEGVSNMQIEYLVSDALKSEPFNYVISDDYQLINPTPLGLAGGSYGWWPSRFNIVAIRMKLTFESPRVNHGKEQAISQDFTFVFSLRNHKF